VALAETYPVLCSSSTAAGNGTQCGDTNASGQDLCPGGDGLTASFNPPTATWWAAQGCSDVGTNCSSCFGVVASSFVKQ
jgi:hypothetical protein